MEGVHQPGIGSGDPGQRVRAQRGGLDLELAAGGGQRHEQELPGSALADGGGGDVLGGLASADPHLEKQPAADRFPRLDEPGPDPLYPLRMWLCAGCGLAQLVEDPTVPEEPRGQEPQALIDQARDAVSRIMAAGLLSPGQDVAEYGSPHGGSWLTLLTSRGLRAVEPTESADGVIDNIGMMHDRDQAAGLASRIARLRPSGILMIQFHSLASILEDGRLPRGASLHAYEAASAR